MLHQDTVSDFVCQRCVDQVNLGPADRPHKLLRHINTRDIGHGILRSSEGLYHCNECRSWLIHRDSQARSSNHWTIV